MSAPIPAPDPSHDRRTPRRDEAPEPPSTTSRSKLHRGGRTGAERGTGKVPGSKKGKLRGAEGLSQTPTEADPITAAEAAAIVAAEAAAGTTAGAPNPTAQGPPLTKVPHRARIAPSLGIESDVDVPMDPSVRLLAQAEEANASTTAAPGPSQPGPSQPGNPGVHESRPAKPLLHEDPATASEGIPRSTAGATRSNRPGVKRPRPGASESGERDLAELRASGSGAWAVPATQAPRAVAQPHDEPGQPRAEPAQPGTQSGEHLAKGGSWPAQGFESHPADLDGERDLPFASSVPVLPPLVSEAAAVVPRGLIPTPRKPDSQRSAQPRAVDEQGPAEEQLPRTILATQARWLPAAAAVKSPRGPG